MHRFFLLLIILPFTIAQSAINPQNATAFSLLYGYPLLAWQKFFATIVEDVGANTWRHARELSTAANHTVVKPNVDTLYSTFIYDLSQSNVEITIPDIPDYELKLFSFYDPFGDNFANIGTGGFYRPGTYLIRPYDRPGGSSDVGLQVTNGTSGQYEGSINSPTTYGTLLVRWAINSTDAEVVHKWQDECGSQVLAPSKNLTDVSQASLQSLISVYNEDDSVAANVMNLLPHYTAADEPTAQLEVAGIANGKYTPVASVNLTLANATAIAEAEAAAEDPANISLLNNGWAVLSPTEIGIYGTNYALRTIVAISSYLALRNPFAVYPTWSSSTSDNANAALTLGPDEAILFTFSGKPPLQPAGFWSLTAYGGDYYLIPNPIDVYALGDRSNVTYSDGSLVYGDNADATHDDMFQILLQPADVAPPANWTNNWLPAPAGGGQVVSQLRFYVAKQPLLDGSYAYPVLEKISAITAGSSEGGSTTQSNAAQSVVSGGATKWSWIAASLAIISVAGGTVIM